MQFTIHTGPAPKRYDGQGFTFLIGQGRFVYDFEKEEGTFKTIYRRTVRRERGDELVEWKNPALVTAGLFEWAVRLLHCPTLRDRTKRSHNLRAIWDKLDQARKEKDEAELRNSYNQVLTYFDLSGIDFKLQNAVALKSDIECKGARISYAREAGTWRFPETLSLVTAVDLAGRILMDRALQSYMFGRELNEAELLQIRQLAVAPTSKPQKQNQPTALAVAQVPKPKALPIPRTRPSMGDFTRARLATLQRQLEEFLDTVS